MQDLSQMSTEELLRMRNAAQQGQTAPRGPVFGPAPAPEKPKTPTPPGPQDIWRDLTPDEIVQRGLAPGGVYQVNQTGAIKTIQAAPKAVAPVSPEAGRERLSRIQTSLDNLRGLERLVSSSDMGTGSIVGQESFRAGEDFAGMSGFFNQRANDVAGSIEMVQGDLINQVRQEMEMSGTPIGVKGADTEKEASRLAASIANLAQTQDEREFLVGLGRAREYYIRRLAATVKQLREAGEQIDPNQFLQSALEGGASGDELKLLASGLDLTVDEDALEANIRSRDEGGPTNSFFTPPQPPSGGGGIVQNLGTSIPNTAVGYAQGAAGAALDFPLDVASGVQTGANALLDLVVGGGLELAGFPQQAEAFRRTGAQEEAIRAGRARASDVIGSALPAPAGFETQRNVAEFAGGFLVPGPKAARASVRAPAPATAPTNAAQVVAEGARRNVPVMTSDVLPPSNAMSSMVTQTVPEKIPLFGTSGPRAAQQESRVQAVKDIVDEFGGNSARDIFDDAVTPAAEVSKLLTAQRSQRLKNLTTAKNSVIDNIRVPFQAAPNTVRAITQQVRDLKAIDEVEFAPVIDRLQRFGERLTSGANLRTVEEQRKLLGAMFDDANLASIKDRGQKAVNAIYDPLRKDMGNFIEAQSGANARAKWAKANEELAAMAGELKSTRFKNVLKDADITPEAVGRILFSSADNNSDMRRLVSNLDETGLKKVQAAIIQRAFDTAGGADGVSVERFLANLGRLSGQVGITFTGRDKEALQGFRRLMDATRRASVATSKVRTGEQNLPTLLGLSVGVSTLGVGGLLARVYESAPARDLLLRLSRTKPGSKQERETLGLIMRATAPIVNTWRENVGRAVNDNTAGALAAEEQNP